MKFNMTEHGFATTTSFGTLDISANDEYGFRPYQLLVSSVAVCSGGVMRKVLEKMRMPADDIAIEVTEVQRNEEVANRIEKIQLHFTISGSTIDTTKMEKVLALTRKNCTMVQSVKDAIEITETFEIL